MAKARPQPQISSVLPAFGVPNALASRRIKPDEFPMAVVEGEDRVKATALRPVPLRRPAHRGGGQVECLVPADPLPAGIGITLRVGPPQRVGQPLGMVDEFRRGAALGAQRLAGRVFWIGFEAGEAAILTTATAPHRAMQNPQYV